MTTPDEFAAEPRVRASVTALGGASESDRHGEALFQVDFSPWFSRVSWPSYSFTQDDVSDVTGDISEGITDRLARGLDELGVSTGFWAGVERLLGAAAREFEGELLRRHRVKP